MTFEVSGGSSLMNSTVDSLCGAVENRTVFNFRGTALQLSKYLTVDGVDYHGTKCGAQVKKQSQEQV